MKRYKDTLKANMKACDIPTADLESLVLDRNSWRTTCREAIAKFESNRIGLLKEKRQRRKLKAAATATTGDFKCDVCGRTCGSRIGLFAHGRTHR